METNWVCRSEALRFCKNDSDSSLESLIVTRVESFCEKRDSSRIESPSFSTWLESSQSHQKSWLESRYHWCVVKHPKVKWSWSIGGTPILLAAKSADPMDASSALTFVGSGLQHHGCNISYQKTYLAFIWSCNPNHIPPSDVPLSYFPSHGSSRVTSHSRQSRVRLI